MEQPNENMAVRHVAGRESPSPRNPPEFSTFHRISRVVPQRGQRAQSPETAETVSVTARGHRWQINSYKFARPAGSLPSLADPAQYGNWSDPGEGLIGNPKEPNCPYNCPFETRRIALLRARKAVDLQRKLNSLAANRRGS